MRDTNENAPRSTLDKEDALAGASDNKEMRQWAKGFKVNKRIAIDFFVNFGERQREADGDCHKEHKFGRPGEERMRMRMSEKAEMWAWAWNVTDRSEVAAISGVAKSMC